jgi:hypothetical protein
VFAAFGKSVVAMKASDGTKVNEHTYICKYNSHSHSTSIEA